jgi:uncharacterized membrane protein YedE/YeeE
LLPSIPWPVSPGPLAEQMKMIRTGLAVLIHAALIVGMLFATYLSLVILACYVPALRFLPGYDPDPLGAAFMLTLGLWPAIGVAGVVAFLLTRLLRISLLTSVSAVAYPAVLGLLCWATDSSSQGKLPSFLRKLPDDSLFWINIVALVVAFVLILIGTRRFARGRTDQPTRQMEDIVA